MKETFNDGMEEKDQIGVDDLDLELELSSDAEGQGGVSGSALASAKLSSKKKEALSQVPCKFFRSNGCSAGSSCPFAHIVPGEGQGKAVCQWFLKGSCRFGHKCALAHILPGQPMSMDRKNKRAAHHQQQAGQTPLSIVQGGQQQAMNLQRGQHDPRQQQINRPSLQHSSSGRGHFDMSNSIMIAGRNGFDEGSSSRNFVPSFSHQQMQQQQNHQQQQYYREVDLLFGIPDDLQGTSMNQGMLSTAPSHSSIGAFRPELKNSHQGDEVDSSIRHSPERGFETIGRSSTSQAFGTSPFSHPGSHSVFYSNDAGEASHSMANRSGLQTAKARNPWQAHEGGDINEEDFLPSSLTELLTPAELSRRGRTGLNKQTSDFTPQSLPSRTTTSTSPWDSSTNLQSQQWKQPSQQGSILTDGEESSLSTARERLARDRAAAAAIPTNALPPPSYLQPGSSNLGISNTSAGFLSSRLRRGLSGGLVDNEVDSLKARPSDAYSPGAQAALSHAPGQSLPQGLAAGLSSLHLRSSSGNEGSELGILQNHSPSNSSTSIWNQQTNNGYTQGAYGKANDELGPTAPSSVFAHRNNPLQMAMARSLGGGGSASTSLDASHHSSGHQSGGLLSVSNNGSVISPYARSPANRRDRNEGGIAIPSNRESPSLTASTNATSNNNNNNSNLINNQQKSIASHPGKTRMRHAGTAVGSPLALPTTGEEVEEPIFELE